MLNALPRKVPILNNFAQCLQVIFKKLQQGNFTCDFQELNEAEKVSEKRNKEVDLRTPDRIFKVVFVGDSAVGKTCFLHRFCYNRFKPLFNATIGVDFTVKTMNVGDRVIALQLWDTAGQERFRSITKQYFRKADGVLLLFDVTSEQSFLNVRNWIESVRNGVEASTV
ncbi:Ras and EF-hand domain-containing protein, partial [Trichostrongylus colubriformis]